MVISGREPLRWAGVGDNGRGLGVGPIPTVPERHLTYPSWRGMCLGCYVPYPYFCLPSPSISYWTEESINPCTKYLWKGTIWGRLRFQLLHSSVQNIGTDSSGIAQFLDVLRLGTLFCAVFIIVLWIESKSLMGVQASEGRTGKKIYIGVEGVSPYLYLQNRLHIMVCVCCVPYVERERWREVYLFSVLASCIALSQTPHITGYRPRWSVDKS